MASRDGLCIGVGLSAAIFFSALNANAEKGFRFHPSRDQSYVKIRKIGKYILSSSLFSGTEEKLRKDKLKYFFCIR